MRAIIIGTGPSLTPEAISLVSQSSLPKFGCNNTYTVADLTALLSCNPEWWDYYYPRDTRLANGNFEKWTWDRATADKYGLSYIRGAWGDGLSNDSAVIHYGHSSGYQLVNLALHYGVSEFVLIGYDLRYPDGYQREIKSGGGRRHFWEGGEYPPQLQHWPKVGRGGEMTGLLDCYRTINPDDYGIRIINCSPGSALNFFEIGSLADEV